MLSRGVAGSEPAEVTGRVVRVLESARTQLVGTLQRGRQFLYVIPDDPRITQDIYVPPPRDMGRPAHVGDKVVVELREWKSRHANPEGEIIEVLGAPDAEGRGHALRHPPIQPGRSTSPRRCCRRPVPSGMK